MFILKFLLALTALLTPVQVKEPAAAEGGTGWRSGKGGNVCVWTRLPNGRSEYRCEKR